MEISVVIPLFNKKDTIINTIKTSLSQSFLPKEIVVVNDGSTDGSELLVKEFDHPLVKLIHQPNQGVSVARNKGIEEASAEWIAFLDADDVWFDHYFESLAHLNRNFPQANILATSYQLENHLGDRAKLILNKIPFEGEFGILSNYFEVAACSHPPIWSSSVTVRKTAIQKIGGFPKGIKSGEDLITWARLAIDNEIAYSLKSGAVFVQVASHTYDDKPNRIPEEPDYVGDSLIKLLQENKKNKNLRNYIAHWAKMRASIYLRLGNKGKAWNEIRKSLSFDATNKKLYFYLILLIFPESITRKLFKSFAA